MRYYQRQKHNPYILPKPVYVQTIWQIKGYYLLKERIDDIINSTPTPDGMQRGSGISDPTAAKGTKIARFQSVVNIIDEEHKKIPEEYRTGVWNSIHYSTRFPDDADVSTYSRHKSRFIYNVAIRLGFY